MNHTPGPWKIVTYNNGKGMAIEDEKGNDVLTKSNARFIVTACNAHEELVDVLRLCKRNVEAQLYMLPYDASEQKDILSSWIGRINGALSLATIEKGS